MSDNEKRVRALVAEMVAHGFTENQSIWLLNFLNNYFPVT